MADRFRPAAAVLEAEGNPRRSPLLPSFLATIYPWTKALHVIAVVAWMAGLFYLPRLFVYHAERGTPGSELSETFKVMERRLLARSCGRR